jgi:hypothetical protein
MSRNDATSAATASDDATPDPVCFRFVKPLSGILSLQAFSSGQRKNVLFFKKKSKKNHEATLLKQRSNGNAGAVSVAGRLGGGLVVPGFTCCPSYRIGMSASVCVASCDAAAVEISLALSVPLSWPASRSAAPLWLYCNTNAAITPVI